MNSIQLIYPEGSYYDAKEQKLCGKYSGIPECCIQFFIFTWELWWHYIHYPLFMQLIKNHDSKIPYYVQYVPCPNCIANDTYVSIRECTILDKELCGAGETCTKWDS